MLSVRLRPVKVSLLYLKVWQATNQQCHSAGKQIISRQCYSMLYVIVHSDMFRGKIVEMSGVWVVKCDYSVVKYVFCMF